MCSKLIAKWKATARREASSTTARQSEGRSSHQRPQFKDHTATVKTEVPASTTTVKTEDPTSIKTNGSTKQTNRQSKPLLMWINQILFQIA